MMRVIQSATMAGLGSPSISTVMVRVALDHGSFSSTFASTLRARMRLPTLTGS